MTHPTLDVSSTVYLIELRGSLTWWDGRGPDTFHYDPNQAVRFARRVDAERVLCWIISESRREECTVTEHSWIDKVDNGR